MGWFTERADPLEKRAREIERELARLDSEMQNTPVDAAPEYRSDVPATDHDPLNLENCGPRGSRKESVRLQESIDSLGSKPSGWRERWARFKLHFGATPATNPKLVKYLSAGNLQGLQPLRYEKRIARNRFFFMFFLLLLVLFGLFAVAIRNY